MTYYDGLCFFFVLKNPFFLQTHGRQKNLNKKWISDFELALNAIAAFMGQSENLADHPFSVLSWKVLS